MKARAADKTVVSIPAIAHDRTNRDRLEAALEKAQDPAGEGARTFIRLLADEARVAADAADVRSRTGTRLGPLDGRLVSLKDVFDLSGRPTTAGSAAYADAPPAHQDAAVVQRLRAAGAVLLGRTNMTEFAFSGLGINPHFGTPRNPVDRTRIPGGSSSGAAVSVADGFCDIGIGTDTGGSVRIPSAFCGLVGFKPTQARVPRTGVLPLSLTLDTIGPLARSVQEVADADAILSGLEPLPLVRPRLSRLRVGVLKGPLLCALDREVELAFERNVEGLRFEGAEIDEIEMNEIFQELEAIGRIGSFSAVEAAWYHRQVLAEREDALDPNVVRRIRTTSAVSGAQYVEMQQRRQAVLAMVEAGFQGCDVLVLPTVAVLPPRFEDLADEAVFDAMNFKVLRNTNPFNTLDLPALTLPIPGAGKLPVGIMLVGRRGADRALLAIGGAVEAAHRLMV